MVSITLIIILVLILILIVYSIFSLGEKESVLLCEERLKLGKTIDKKYNTFTSDYLFIDKNTSYVLYYNLSLNCIYWTVGIYDEDVNIDEINMSKYQTPQDGDTLVIIIGNNQECIQKSKKKVKDDHLKKFPFKRIMFDYLITNSNFYLDIKCFSNYFETPIDISLKKLVFDDIKYVEPCVKELEVSKNRNTEDMYLFKKTFDGFIDDSFYSLAVTKDIYDKNIPYTSLMNMSAILDVTQYKKDEYIFHIVAMDHFKSRSSLHSNICCFDAETNKLIRIEITSEISDRLNTKRSISVRRIRFKIPENVNYIYFIEYIYCDFATGNKPNVDSIIPMHIFVKKL